jgi:hypothetical protein
VLGAMSLAVLLLYGRYHHVSLFVLGNLVKVGRVKLLSRKEENDCHLTIFLIIEQRSLSLQLKNPTCYTLQAILYLFFVVLDIWVFLWQVASVAT